MIAILANVPGVNSAFFHLNFSLQTIVDGLTNGAIYAAMALAVVVIFRTTGHLNLAQGEMATFATFVVATLAVDHGWAVWLAIPVTVVASMAVGASIERVFVRRLDSREPTAVLMVTLALFLIFNSLSSAIWGIGERAPAYPFPSGLHDRWILVHGSPNVVISFAAALTWATLAAATIALWLLLQKTRIGLAYRAVASDRESSLRAGIPVGRMLMFAWGLAAGIGTIAGVIVADLTSQLNYNLMQNVLIYGFAAACLGGFDSITGALVGGALVGLVEAVVPSAFTFIGPELGLTMALLVITVVLLRRPQGLFGSQKVIRV